MQCDTIFNFHLLLRSKSHPRHPNNAIVDVNYLEVNNLINIPVFDREQNKEVLTILQKACLDRQIETIDYDDVALEGDLKKCTTWACDKGHLLFT